MKFKNINGTVTLVLRPTVTPKLLGLLKTILNIKTKRNIQFQFLLEDQSKITKILDRYKISKINFISREDLYKKSDCIVTLGGDGTLIHVCRNSNVKKTPPIMAVNLGHLGFIAQYTPKEFIQELEHSLQNNYHISPVALFKVNIKRKGKTVFSSHFFNDVVLSKTNISRVFSLEVNFNQDHIFNVSGDGIIVSSPHGSTAYSLAANGPILHPKVKAMLITPICPHGLTYRPVAIPDDKIIDIKLHDNPTNIVLTVDGQETFDITKDDQIFIRKDSQKIVNLLENPNRSYFQSLKEKFFHGKGH